MPDLILPAPLWRRFAAAAYDFLLLIALLLPSTWFAVMLRDAFGIGAAAQHWPLFLRALYLLVGLAFFGWFWVHRGQTLGMLAWRLRVRSSDGGTLRWPAAASRYAVMLPSWALALGTILLTVLPGKIAGAQAHSYAVGCALATLALALSAQLDSRRRTLHDRIAGTEVVLLPRKRREAASS